MSWSKTWLSLRRFSQNSLSLATGLYRTPVPLFMKIWQTVQSLTLRQTEAAWRTHVISFFHFVKNAWSSVRLTDRQTVLPATAGMLLSAIPPAAVKSSSSGQTAMEFCCSKKRNGTVVPVAPADWRLMGGWHTFLQTVQVFSPFLLFFFFAQRHSFWFRSVSRT